MKSLTCLSSVAARLPIEQPTSTPTATAFDPQTGNVYSVLETPSPNGGVQVDFLAVQGYREDQIHKIASYRSTTSPNFKSRFNSTDRHVVSLQLLSESQSLCLILKGGDIASVSIDFEEDTLNEVEVVGIVDAGIKAAAWSPDEELLVLITGDDKLLQMTKDFEVLNDTPLRSQEFGEDEAINVGWGSKATQFHGSAGKAAATATSTLNPLQTSSTPDDDHLPRVSWRGDGAHFAVSTLDPSSLTSNTSPNPDATRRVIRTYSRQAILQSTSEPIAGLEHPLAWRPSGNLIASVQRFGSSFEGGGEGREGKHDVVFFERNGLRHGEFELRETREKFEEKEEGGETRGWDYRVRDLSWNSDSTVLAVWLDRRGELGDVVQLWTMNNYYWYLKQEITALSLSATRFTSVDWHPEEPLKLAVLTSCSMEIRSFCWDTYGSVAAAERDTGVVAVVDGASTLVTPFRTQNVPPPYSTSKITNAASTPSSFTSRPTPPPIHIAFSPSSDLSAQLFPSGLVHLRRITTKLTKGVPGRPQTIGEPVVLQLAERAKGRQVAVNGKGEVAVLGWDIEEERDTVWVHSGRAEGGGEWKDVRLGGSGAGKLIGLEEQFIYQSREGEVSLVQEEDDFLSLHPLDSSLPSFCPTVRSTTFTPPTNSNIPSPSSSPSSDPIPIIFALSPLGKLYALTPTSSEPYHIASDCTSFGTSADFLIYTTTTHESKYAPLSVIARVLDGGWVVSEQEKEWEKRRVERGSLIVTVVSETMALVLQMPRGNLETVYPRPLVLAGVRRDISACRYRDAFLTCRKHRIDLNILYDHDPSSFMTNLSSFVSQIEDVDYINLFLGGLKNDDVSKSMYPPLGVPSTSSSSKVPNKINKICDAVRTELDSVSLLKYVDSILTAHVVKNPPDYESALRMLHRLKGQHGKVVEDAVKYVIFLADVNQLFDVALGMYDFQLVLMIAQYSQKDPREYMPFLKELRALDRYYQRFRIDDHLERYPSALRNLHLAGKDRFEEAVSYVEKHDLHKESLAIWAEEPEQLKVLYEVYADHLYHARHFTEAALIFSLADNKPRAMKSYEKAHAWKELFTLAITEKLEEGEIAEMCERVANHLASRGKYVEAGRIWLDYGHDLPEAVSAFCKGRDFSEAYRVVALNGKPELVEEIIYPGLVDAQSNVLEDIKEVEDQMDKQIERLEELKRLKKEQPESFFMQDDPALENIDVMTDATQATTFTRYTQNASTVLTRMTGQTKTTNQSSKNRRKAERKKAGGRKGTVDEEEYLLGSLSRLVEKFKGIIADSAPLIIHLRLSAEPSHPSLARELQAALVEMEESLRKAVDVAWFVEGASEEEPEDGETPSKVEEEVPKKEPRPTKPVVGEWKGGFLGSSA